MSWSPLPPGTREAQFDEKWAFVAKKEAHCDRSDPADDRKGDCWDHVAPDPEHRLVVAVVPGKRTAENAAVLVDESHRRTGGRPMDLITTDEYPPTATRSSGPTARRSRRPARAGGAGRGSRTRSPPRACCTRRSTRPDARAGS